LCAHHKDCNYDSRGNGCADEWPGVYARISYQYQWIKDLVCATSSAPPSYFECNPFTIANVPGSNPVDVPSQSPLAQHVPAPTAVAPTSTTTHIINNAPEGTIPVKVKVQLDLRSTDTGWSLVNNDGDVITEVKPGEYETPYELVEEILFLPTSSQFVFVIKDTQGDGICCEFGGGWFQVSTILTDGTEKPLVKGYGTFSLSSTNVFMTPIDNTPLLILGDGQLVSPGERPNSLPGQSTGAVGSTVFDPLAPPEGDDTVNAPTNLVASAAATKSYYRGTMSAESSWMMATTTILLLLSAFQ